MGFQFFVFLSANNQRRQAKAVIIASKNAKEVAKMKKELAALKAEKEKVGEEKIRWKF